ncbi:hypothetical protein SCLCIDRAFT_1213568 [Scleroderma citrinum Foug A]|uniref:Uncharacterized protein n=1 Tax=Scleroderma citrinum Foug A TaxID=1036808 RepID=A0A0C3E848_9AGAM|nr:hypothetical protein SCLCIDRAFT_1213568 [Scleroderma citrinum Foug A]
MPDEVGITNQSRNPKAFAMCALSADGDYVPPGYWLHSKRYDGVNGEACVGIGKSPVVVPC